MRVVHVVRQFSPSIGGLETYVASLASQQIERGYQVQVLTLDRDFTHPGHKLESRALVDGVQVERLPFVGSSRYSVAPRALGAIRGFDLVHVHGVDFFVDFFAVTRRWHDRPLVLSTHGGFFHTRFAHRLKKLYFHTVTRSALSQVEIVHACSEQDFANFQRIAPRHTYLVENAVDTAKFGNRADRASRNMIYFGRLAENKGLVDLLNWFAAVMRGEPSINLVIAGRSTEDFAARLRATAEQLGIGPSVTILESPSEAELAGCISRSGAYVGASTYEGFGLAAVEAISAGLYPILNDIPTFRRTIERVGFGTLIDFSDPGTVARALSDMDAHRRQPQTAAALSAAVDPFSWGRVTDAIAGLYDLALAERPTAPARARNPGA